jgi:hypothetical protein
MLEKILITLGVITFGLGVPFLEINASHVFNQDWTPHARLHEVWQLITNTSLAAMCLWFVWIRSNVVLPAAIGLMVTTGFLLAYVIRGSYGGSGKYLDGSEKLVFGMNIGVFGFTIVTFMFLIAIFLHRTKDKITE